MLVCPDCNHILIAETIPTDAPGGVVTIEQCPNCGGVWFDHFEINRFPTYYAIALAGQLPEKRLKKVRGSNLCPHCGVKLKPVKVAKKTHVRMCSHCRGHFVSKKDLLKVKEAQQAGIAQAKLLGIPISSAFALVIPLLLFSLIIVTIPLTIKRLEEANRARIRAKELIGTPILIPIDVPQPARAVIISFTTAKAVTAKLELRAPERTQPVTVTVSSLPQKLHTIKLTGLSPTTTYTYTIIVEDEYKVKTTSEEYQFTTN